MFPSRAVWRALYLYVLTARDIAENITELGKEL